MRKQLTTRTAGKNRLLAACLLLFFATDSSSLQAQDLEPRRWSHLPIGLNVFGIAGASTSGDIFFDPVLLIQDATFDLYSTGFGYVRSFELLGKSARFDVNVPYASGRWEGLLNGEYESVRRTGLMDPRLRFSINLLGAPPLKGKAFLRYRQENPVTTTVGAAISLRLPLGEYSPDRLINLGANRYVLRPQLGVLHQRNDWQFELTGSVFLYQDNNEFFLRQRLERDPLWFAQGHVIYSFKPGWWASLSGGYAHGGRSWIDGNPKLDDSRTSYFALGLGMPINQQQSIKISYVTSDTNISVGQDTDSLIFAWSVNWGH